MKLAYVWDTNIARIMPNVHASYMHEFSSDSQIGQNNYLAHSIYAGMKITF